MLDNVTTPELRRELHAERTERLRVATRPALPGALRLALGGALVTAGERLRGLTPQGSVPRAGSPRQPDSRGRSRRGEQVPG